MNRVYKELQNSLSGFLENLRIAQGELAGVVSSSLESQFESLSSKIVDRLNASMESLQESSLQLRENTSQIGDLVKQTNDLYLNREKEEMLDF